MQDCIPEQRLRIHHRKEYTSLLGRLARKESVLVSHKILCADGIDEIIKTNLLKAATCS